VITLASADLNVWLTTFLWPFTRILALLAGAPVLGNMATPTRLIATQHAAPGPRATRTRARAASALHGVTTRST